MVGLELAALAAAGLGLAALQPKTATGPTPAPSTPPPAPAPNLAEPHLSAFVRDYTGHYLNFDSNPYGAQCVEVPNLWCVILGIEKFPGNAATFEFDAHPDCDWIGNTPTNFPLPGDIVVWSARGVPPYGHVAVALAGANANRFTSFDQNWPLKSACHQQGHTYAGVAGWLRPRKLHPAGSAY